ncbi:DUF1566 domain-containing protein [Leptospira ognonensis]|nr:DUF1566 domain-containing protein [Leptospira ognonensis]
MKIKTILLIILLGIIFQCNKNPIENRAFVDASGGLRIRSTSDQNSAILTTIPDKAELIIIEEKGDVFEISGRKGKWTKVKYKQFEGWVFGGFIKYPLNEDQTKNSNINSDSITDFNLNNDGTVTNKKDNLIWTRCFANFQKETDGKCIDFSDQHTLTFSEANQFCENLELAGNSDWRLPTKSDLMNLYDCKNSNVDGNHIESKENYNGEGCGKVNGQAIFAIKPEIFANNQWAGQYTWTSTEAGIEYDPIDRSVMGKQYWAALNFRTGLLGKFGGENTRGSVMCIRN